MSAKFDMLLKKIANGYKQTKTKGNRKGTC